MDCKAVEDAAKQFRNAIDRVDKSRLSAGFDRFPRGSCEDASRLLAIFLREQGLGDFQLVSGEAEVGFHSWLERDGVLVDITADQFDGIDIPVVVGIPDRWYGKFSKNRRIEAATLESNITADVNLAADYKLILCHL